MFTIAVRARTDHLSDMNEPYATPGPIIKYYGEFNRSFVNSLVNLIGDDEDSNRIAYVFVKTPGGDPHAAFRLGRLLQRRFAGYVLIVDDYCKSAGTIFALGALQVMFAPMAELGPIDVQLKRQDELANFESGLETVQSTAAIIDFTFSTFETMLLGTVARSGGSISSKMAAGLAAEVAGKLGSQLVCQLDPVWMGRVHRAMAIAKEYGQRLDCGNLQDGAIDRLMADYPDHGFVIDVEEAARLFKSVGVCAAPVRDLMQAFDSSPVQYVPTDKADPIWDSTGIAAMYAAAAAQAEAARTMSSAVSAAEAAEAAALAAAEAAAAAEVAGIDGTSEPSDDAGIQERRPKRP